MEIANFKNEPYLFLVVNPTNVMVGIKPKKILHTWHEVEQAFGSGYLLGYIGYEQGYDFVTQPPNSVLQHAKKDAVTLPDVYFGVFDEVIVLPHPLAPCRPLNPLKGTLKKWFPPLGGKGARAVRSNFTKSHYLDLFNQVHNHIKLGDIYQANLSQRLTMPYSGTAFDLFCDFYNAQPTPYSALIQTPEVTIVSNSPELFLKVKNNVVETRPIKGTIPRGANPVEDERNKQILLHSEKDQAELAMIVDLHRNDLNRTAKPGTVTVIQPRQLVPYTTVWQAEAVIQSHIDAQYTSLDVIKTCFPAGSITGAPKVRAMEIIHELEPNRRNVYTGSIGYIAPNGDLELNVAIRTAILHNQQLYYNVGSGIVFDSQAEAEYQETLDKAKILLTP